MSSTANEQPPPDAAPDPAASGRAGAALASERFAAARLRLRAAFGALDAAISRRAERALEQVDQFAEHAALQDDRSRLAVELDDAARRARALETANFGAARRIERAAAAVRAVLAADSSAETCGPNSASEEP
ncbi:DUF4164 family protein [Rhodoblastus sp.]|uniref:DUF4164 family protein n=1 Tax=Rhodoblastus sp. TaxID=1962975 RepID=UPI003F977082